MESIFSAIDKSKSSSAPEMQDTAAQPKKVLYDEIRKNGAEIDRLSILLKQLSTKKIEEQTEAATDTIRNLSGTLNSWFTQLSERLAMLQKSDTVLEDCQKTIVTINTSISEIQAYMAEVRSDITTIEEGQRTVESYREELKRDVKEMALDAEIATLKQALDAEVVSLNDPINKLTLTVKSVLDMIDKFELMSAERLSLFEKMLTTKISDLRDVNEIVSKTIAGNIQSIMTSAEKRQNEISSKAIQLIEKTDLSARVLLEKLEKRINKELQITVDQKKNFDFRNWVIAGTGIVLFVSQSISLVRTFL